MSRAKTLYGTSEPAIEETILTAGPLSAMFSGGALRSVSVQGVEVIRGLYFLIRDRNWATVVPDLRDLEIEQLADRFSVRFAAHCVTPADGQTLVWRGAITGSAADGLRFEAEATPESDLLTRRTGFVILHPLERVVGARVTIEHVDGRMEETRFPDLIDPLQCFFDIRAMTHEPIPGIRATCRMEGGGWETEDHRNWLDASFKTYFRALALPHPYTLPAGEQVRQSVVLTFTPSIATLSARDEAEETTISVGDRTGGTMPRIGLSATPGDLDEGIARAGLLHDIGAQELSLRLRSDDTDLPGILRRAARLSDALDVDLALELAVSTRSDTASELDVVRVAADAAGFSPRSVFVTPEVDLGAYPPSVERPPSPPLADLYGAAREAFPESLLGGGMFHFFTELNRRRPPVELLDFVQHSSAANVHAADDRSVMETLESLPHVFRSVRAIAGGAAYRVGPAHIGMAVNPYGDATTPNPDSLRRTMVTHDPRHGAQFGAAYATGYLARAAIAGLDTVIMGAVAGPFGVTAGDRPAPMFHVIAGFARLAGAATLQAASSNPRQVLAVAAEGTAGREVWMANLTPARQRIRLDGMTPSELSVIDENSSGVAEVRPLPGSEALVLEPYAVARVTW